MKEVSPKDLSFSTKMSLLNCQSGLTFLVEKMQGIIREWLAIQSTI